MTKDGIPMIVNGRELSEMEIGILREAKERREQIALEDAEREIGGADRTTNPTRYGDWEKAGRAVDFS
ncbi:DUF1674 domain-containing protein [Parvularcula marina]|uniref:DUF1674 domain-containing protein n=2 Tax=Parvularcula marina TaxID=2292771 RepID=A0A371RLV2_9PROT|nr:DUF1674 domain-containing protein [Parvularcula marina]